MRESFTPGPWEMTEANTTIPIRGANGKTVASVKYGSNDLYNARLIAAAPDLYAALRELLATCRLESVPVDVENRVVLALNKAVA